MFSPIGKLTLMTALACIPFGTLQAQTAPATTTPQITTEVINFGTTPTAGMTTTKQAATVPDLYVNTGDSVTVILRSYAPATTPIELYFLVFDTDDMPVKKLTVGTVKNPKVGVFKKYKIVMNKTLLDTVVVGKAEYMRAGYCIGGCGTPGANKLIQGRIILPQKLPLSSDSLAI